MYTHAFPFCKIYLFVVDNVNVHKVVYAVGIEVLLNNATDCVVSPREGVNVPVPPTPAVIAFVRYNPFKIGASTYFLVMT